jgi:DNA-binding MarR family transcriptional regulator
MKYANQAQQRVLRTLAAIVRHGGPGLTPGEIAAQVGTIPSNATRDIANLIAAGLVEKTRSGRITAKPLLAMFAAANAA